ncbi:MAG TPA: hypothetical protein VIE37_10630 [Methylomirabilota bacterium]|jgi:hypothetical protein
MTRAQVLLFAALVLAPLFSLLMRAVKKRLAGQAPPDLELEAPSVPAPGQKPTAPVIGVGARPRDTPLRRATAMGATAPAAGSRLGEVRRGIVLMTVLGPCRALEPPGA